MTQDTVPDGFVPFPDIPGFAHLIGPIYTKIDITGGHVGFRVLEKHLNPAGICHGGMMMSVMDMAVGTSVIIGTRIPGFPPSITLNCEFLRPAKLGDWLQSDLRFIHSTRRMGFADGILNGPDGPVFKCSGIVRLPNPEAGDFVPVPAFQAMLSQLL